MKRLLLYFLGTMTVASLAHAEFRWTRDPRSGQRYCSEYSPNGRYLGDVHPMECERASRPERRTTVGWEYSRYQDQYVCVAKDSRGMILQEIPMRNCIDQVGVRYRWAYNNRYRKDVCVMTTPNGGIITEANDDRFCERRSGFWPPNRPQPNQPAEPPPTYTPPQNNGLNRSQIASAAAEYAVVVYINKSATGPFAQRMIVRHVGAIIFDEKISTGREQNEKPPKGEPYFSSTPTGFFTPTILSKDHKSKLWEADMPYAIFFNGGIAIHQVPESAIGKLGTRASGGCIRAPGAVAAQLFDIVEREGEGPVPVISRDGVVSRSRQERYRTLIVVEDSASSNPPIYNSLFNN